MIKSRLRNNKKVILIIPILLILILIYFIIPLSNTFSFNTESACSESAASRIILNINTWKTWWPGKKEQNNFYYKAVDYKINKIMYSGINFTLYSNSDSINGKLIIEGSDRSTIFGWESNFIYSKNPIKRIIQYFDYLSFRKNISEFLQDLKKYFDKEENIYGLKIYKQNVSEESLISLKQTFNHEPNTQDIYALIDSLELYINTKGGQKTKLPMLHISTEDSINYTAMVALPTTFDLPSEGNFRMKKMVMGKILMAEVKGGPAIIERGEKEMGNYLTDYKKISPAISFETLVTNRRDEPDTSKWITRLYFPIFN